MKTVLILALIVAAMLAYVRFSQLDPARWHVDPVQAGDPGGRGVQVHHAIALPPKQALQAFGEVARAQPRTVVLAGSVAEGRITYVTRSKWIGFPDLITVQAIATDTGSDLVILSRLRFGYSDLGVNADRLGRWLQLLQPVPN